MTPTSPSTSASGGIQVGLLDEQMVEVDLARLVRAATQAASLEFVEGEISLTLVDEARMARLNEVWMRTKGPTDVLSFPIDGFVAKAGGEDVDMPPVLIGEVVVCPQYVKIFHADDLDDELELLVVHGVLHLAGYDHQTKDQADRMRAKEIELTGRAGATAV